jgi:hypothetical protein
MAELTTADYAAVVAAREALVRSLTRQFPPRHAQHLAAVAVVGQFSSLCASSTGTPELIEVINSELAEVGYALVKRPPN